MLTAVGAGIPSSLIYLLVPLVVLALLGFLSSAEDKDRVEAIDPLNARSDPTVTVVLGSKMNQAQRTTRYLSIRR